MTVEVFPDVRALQHDPAVKESKNLLRYVLLVAILVFTGRAMPLSFLPLVLQNDFEQSGTVVGVVMAVYPLAALLTTPVVARLARRTKRIVALHSWAIIALSCAMLLTSLTVPVQRSWGTLCAVSWLSICRWLQGMGVSLYLSANTSLVTRKFSHKLPYVVAMIEVSVGTGGQLGRFMGGFLFDLGGFACPFVVIGVLQFVVAVAGFRFEEAAEPMSSTLDSGEVVNERPQKTPLRELITPRVCLGASGAFMSYFASCFLDTTLPRFLMVHLAPVSVGVMGMAISLRGLFYLITSFVGAHLMHWEIISFEFLLLLGFAGTFCAQLLMGPQAFVEDLEMRVDSWSLGVKWCTVVLAFFVSGSSNANQFVPSLPLMQSEVRQIGLGDVALEEVAEIFVTMMALGEMIGPVFGGWLVSKVGFQHATLTLGCLYIPLILLLWASYDRAAIRARHCDKVHPLVPVHLSGDDAAICLSGAGATCVPLIVPSDEASFAWRRIPFALAVQRQMYRVPGSAPSSVFRKRFVSEATPKPFMTMPSGSFRRKYEPPTLSAL
eukprot:CAMPEP_0194548190 /NCGR_PEP_ID=MMETSP0253-20130528/93260_1 /TAXON_ID=2966 /ORGANISM="Noctiluca scintillans" /LENGTH=549 /DNA_ID=CAMNT_0039395475 /DNA_START=12 /DNA_END=1661 /DNA_ORIENTATION=-